MIKFEAVLAHSRPAEEVSLDQQAKPKLESEHPADNIAKIVISMMDNNQAPAVENTDLGAETTKEAGFSTQPRCWVGFETGANLILPDRYA